MGKESPFLIEPNGIVRTWIDNDDGSYTVKSVQANETEIIEENKAMANHNDGYTPSRDIQRVGRIPLLVIEQYAAQGVNLYSPEWEHVLQRIMDDPDYRYFRTAPGRLGKKHRHI
jgi:hypothetical protein